jgi:hypothetical protein
MGRRAILAINRAVLAVLAEIRRLRAAGVTAFPAYRHDPQMHAPHAPWFHTHLPGSTVVLGEEGSGVVSFTADPWGLRPSPGQRPEQPWRHPRINPPGAAGVPVGSPTAAPARRAPP